MRKAIFILASGIIVLIFIILFFVFQTLSGNRPSSNIFTTPTPIQVVPGARSPSPAVNYNKEKSDELVDKATNRGSLSPQGVTAKATILSSLGNRSGTPYSGTLVTVEYNSSPDLFQGQINSTNISQAKQEAVNWLISQGFTKEDVCLLPLSFYLSPTVSQQLSETGYIFNPLPEGC